MAATLNTTVIQNASSSTANITLDTAGNVTGGANLVATGMPYGSSSFLRNRIINGGMQVAQYGTSVTPTNLNFTYAMDRFFCALNAGTSGFTVTQLNQANTALSGFYNAFRYQRNSGQTSTTTMAFGQTIETSNCYDLAGQSVTLSFYARAGSNFSAASSQITARIATGSGVDQGSNSAYNGTWTGYAQTNTVITVTTSWVRYTVTVSIPSGTNEIQVLFYWAGTGTAGTNDYLDVTGVQLEQGSVATPFERPLYSKQLADCQRYYYAWVFGSTDFQELVARTSTTGFDITTYLPVTMRTQPSLVNPAGGTAYGSIVGYDSTYSALRANVTAMTVQTSQSYSAIHLACTNATMTQSQSQGSASWDTAVNNSTGMGFSAEL